MGSGLNRIVSVFRSQRTDTEREPEPKTMSTDPTDPTDPIDEDEEEPEPDLWKAYVYTGGETAEVEDVIEAVENDDGSTTFVKPDDDEHKNAWFSAGVLGIDLVKDNGHGKDKHEKDKNKKKKRGPWN